MVWQRYLRHVIVFELLRRQVLVLLDFTRAYLVECVCVLRIQAHKSCQEFVRPFTYRNARRNELKIAWVAREARPILWCIYGPIAAGEGIQR